MSDIDLAILLALAEAHRQKGVSAAPAADKLHVPHALPPRFCMTPISRIKSRSAGAFSQREMVGLEHRSVPLSGNRPQASSNRRVAAQPVEIVGVLVAAGMAKMRARRMSGGKWVTRS